MLTIYLTCFVLYGAGFFFARTLAGPELRRDLSPALIAILIGLLAITIVRPPLLLLTAIYGVGMMIGVRSRIDLLCRYLLLSVLTVPLSSPLTIGSLYLLIFTSQHALTIGFGLALLALPRPSGSELRPLPYGAFLIWLIFAITAFGYDRTYSLTNLPRLVLTGVLDFVMPFYLIRSCINRTADVPRLFACFIGGAIILVPFALFEARMGWAPIDTILSVLGGPVSFAKSAVVRGGLVRASATFSVTLAFALFMALSLVATVAFRDRLRSRFHWRVALGTILVGLLLAQSRGAWITLAAAAVAYYALRGRFAQLTAVAAAAGVAFALLLALSSVSPQIAAFLGVNPGAGGQITDYRQALLNRGFEEALKAPLIGQDLNDVQVKLADLKQGQGIIDFVNTYLTFFLGAGLLGVLPFIIGQIALLVGLSLTARRRTNPPELQNALYFIGASFGGMMLFLFFCSFFDRVPLMFILLVAAAKTSAPVAMKVIQRPPGLRRRRQLVASGAA